MLNDLNVNNSNWTLIIIKDPLFLPGKSISNIIQLIQNIVRFKFVILDYIYGAYTSSLVKKEKTIIQVDDLINILPEVEQFDWGDFFLFKEYPKNWNDPKGALYPYVISQTDTTVRAVDDTYIYIYTPYKEIADIVIKSYEIESIKTDILENLEFPD